MHEYIIEGGFPIHGTITASGNKNAALPCIAATLLSAEPVILHNIPEIEDTSVMLNILQSFGVKITNIKRKETLIVSISGCRLILDHVSSCRTLQQYCKFLYPFHQSIH